MRRRAVLLAWLTVAGLCAVVLAQRVCAADVAGALEESLREESAKAREREAALLELTQEERQLHGDLAASSDRLRAFEADVAAQEGALVQVQEEEVRAQNLYADLVRDKKRAMASLRAYLAGMWRFHVHNELAGRESGELDWAQSDRELAWTAEVYRATLEKFDTVRDKQAEAQAVLARKQDLASRARTRLAMINADKNRMLADKLDMMRRLATVREEKVTREAQLQRVLEAISNLNYQLSLTQQPSDRQFASLKGALPWPASGKVVASFSEAAKPPRRGVGLSLREGDAVRSVGWGTVAHNDVLRGFGRVIIVMHGENYYSLYAFLSEGNVAVGDEVKQGQVLGKAGYYPEAGGAGLYFELRFHEKAINPKTWLIALQ
ncbi:MAG: murein hydrolase activator EnvC [Desulfovibrionaceae bacterium]